MRRDRKPPTQFPTTAYLTDGNVPPPVLRAHTIADTIRALVNAGVFAMMQAEERDAVAAELQVPALWLDAAVCEGMDAPRVSLDLLEEFRSWRAALPAAKGGA